MVSMVLCDECSLFFRQSESEANKLESSDDLFETIYYGVDINDDVDLLLELEKNLGREIDHLEVQHVYDQLAAVFNGNVTHSLLETELRSFLNISRDAFLCNLSPIPEEEHVSYQTIGPCLFFPDAANTLSEPFLESILINQSVEPFVSKNSTLPTSTAYSIKPMIMPLKCNLTELHPWNMNPFMFFRVICPNAQGFDVQSAAADVREEDENLEQYCSGGCRLGINTGLIETWLCKHHSDLSKPTQSISLRTKHDSVMEILPLQGFVLCKDDARYCDSINPKAICCSSSPVQENCMPFSHPIDELWWLAELDASESAEVCDGGLSLPEHLWQVHDALTMNPTMCASTRASASLKSRLTEIRFLARGTFSHVHSAVLDGSIPVVIKVIDVDEARMGLPALPHVFAEVVALQHLGTWSGAVQLLDYSAMPTETGGTQFWLVLEQCHSDLRCWLNRLHAPEVTDAKARHDCAATALRAFSTCTQLVADLHEQNIAHCDLKPDNILLRNHGSDQLVLADFAHAVMFAAPEQAIIRDCRGSQAYQCPELLLGLPSDARAADVWALGCILYELLTGEVLFRNDWARVAAAGKTALSRQRQNTAENAATAVLVQNPNNVGDGATDCREKRCGDALFHDDKAQVAAGGNTTLARQNRSAAKSIAPLGRAQTGGRGDERLSAYSDHSTAPDTALQGLQAQGMMASGDMVLATSIPGLGSVSMEVQVHQARSMSGNAATAALENSICSVEACRVGSSEEVLEEDENMALTCRGQSTENGRFHEYNACASMAYQEQSTAGSGTPALQASSLSKGDDRVAALREPSSEDPYDDTDDDVDDRACIAFALEAPNMAAPTKPDAQAYIVSIVGKAQSTATADDTQATCRDQGPCNGAKKSLVQQVQAKAENPTLAIPARSIGCTGNDMVAFWAQSGCSASSQMELNESKTVNDALCFEARSMMPVDDKGIATWDQSAKTTDRAISLCLDQLKTDCSTLAAEIQNRVTTDDTESISRDQGIEITNVRTCARKVTAVDRKAPDRQVVHTGNAGKRTPACQHDQKALHGREAVYGQSWTSIGVEEIILGHTAWGHTGSQESVLVDDLLGRVHISSLEVEASGQANDLFGGMDTGKAIRQEEILWAYAAGTCAETEGRELGDELLGSSHSVQAVKQEGTALAYTARNNGQIKVSDLAGDLLGRMDTGKNVKQREMPLAHTTRSPAKTAESALADGLVRRIDIEKSERAPLSQRETMALSLKPADFAAQITSVTCNSKEDCLSSMHPGGRIYDPSYLQCEGMPMWVPHQQVLSPVFELQQCSSLSLLITERELILLEKSMKSLDSDAKCCVINLLERCLCPLATGRPSAAELEGEMRRLMALTKE